jgi:hypothetical protein
MQILLLSFVHIAMESLHLPNRDSIRSIANPEEFCRSPDLVTDLLLPWYRSRRRLFSFLFLTGARTTSSDLSFGSGGPVGVLEYAVRDKPYLPADIFLEFQLPNPCYVPHFGFNR